MKDILEEYRSKKTFLEAQHKNINSEMNNVEERHVAVMRGYKDNLNKIALEHAKVVGAIEALEGIGKETEALEETKEKMKSEV